LVVSSVREPVDIGVRIPVIDGDGQPLTEYDLVVLVGDRSVGGDVAGRTPQAEVDTDDCHGTHRGKGSDGPPSPTLQSPNFDSTGFRGGSRGLF